MSDHRTRLAVLGSCVSQQVVRVLGFDRGSLVANFARMSLATATMPMGVQPLSATEILENLDLPGNPRRWLATELSKSVPKELTNARPDVLLIDFIEERFDLLQLESGLLVTESGDFIASGLSALPSFQGARQIPRLSHEAMELWYRGVLRLRELMKQNLRDCRIVLLMAPWAAEIQAPSGRVLLPDATEILPGRVVSRDAHVVHLRHCVDRFLEVFPDALVIDPGAENGVTDPTHHWGPGPFHYLPAFYTIAAEQLRHAGIYP